MVPQVMGGIKSGGVRNNSSDLDSRGLHDQSGGQPRLPPNPSSQPSATARVSLTSASAMARGTKPAVTPATGGKTAPAGQPGRNPAGYGYWGVPQHIIDATARGAKSTAAPPAADVGHGSGGGSSRQSFSTWGQLKNADPWGVPIAANAKHGDRYSDASGRWSQNVVQKGRERPVTQAWETWGKPPGWTKPDPGWGDMYDVEEEEEEEESSDSEEWEILEDNRGHPHAQAWSRWGQETKKVTFAPLGSEGTKGVVSPQQRSEILNSLLNLSQNQNLNSGQQGHRAGVLRHTQQMDPNQKKQSSKHQQKSQKQVQHEHRQQQQQQQQQQLYQQQQHQQQQQQQQHQDHGGKKAKKQKGKQKETPKQSDGWGNTGDDWGTSADRWSAGDDDWNKGHDENDGWEAANNSWGTDGWGDGTGNGWDDNGWGGGNDKGRGRGNDKGGGRGNDKGRGRGNDKGRNDNGWGTGTTNDKGWGESNDKGWGESNDKGRGRGNDKSRDDNGWGQDQAWGNDDGWGTIPEENEDENEDEDADPHWDNFTTSKNQISTSSWGRRRAETSYPMPSKTFAHASRGSTTSIDNGPPSNKFNEHRNMRFIESSGKALAPVWNALFGKARMAKDRIHWMFSPNKDERVSSLLSWIQNVEYDLGTYGVSFA
jgi:hypothetical protein